MTIILALNNYSNLTGSELYVYELARILKKRKHTPIILANKIDGEIARRTHALGIAAHEFFAPPDFTPDIVHVSHSLSTAYTLRFFPSVPHVVTIHSPLVYEHPLKHDHIRKYIFVRPEIRDKYPKLDGVVIYNGVDLTRFNVDNTTQEHDMLFVGTADYLRYKVVEDLLGRAKSGEMEVTLVGQGFPLPPVWDIEQYVKSHTKTASVYMGRTTIEGWACGKEGWIYDVDEEGNIKDISVTEPPKDMTPFDIEFMTDRMLEVYESVK